MAKFEITSPDGSVYEVTGPDGSTEQDAINYVKRNQTKLKAKPDRLKFGLTDYEMPTAEELASHPFARFAHGAASGVVGLSQLLEQSNNPFLSLPMIAGRKAREAVGAPDLVERYKETERLQNAGLGDKWNVAGFAGKIFDPVALGVGRTMPRAKTFGQRMSQNTQMGSLYSVIQPYMGEDGNISIDKLADAVIGAVGGALAQGVVVEPVRYASKLVRQFFTQAGAKEVAKKVLDNVLGDGNLDKLVARVEQKLSTIGKGPVPEYRPTTGELVADAPQAGPFLTLQYEASKASGGSSALFKERELGQKAAIRNALLPITGKPGDLEAAVRRADFNAAQNYGPLMGRRVSPESDATILMREIQAARGIPERPWFGPSSAMNADTVRGSPNSIVSWLDKPDLLLRTPTGRAGALQQWGKAVGTEAEQTSFAKRWFPVPGMPRAPAKYSPHAEVAVQAREAAKDALEKAGILGKEADFLQVMLDRLDRAGVGAKQGLDQMSSRPAMAEALAYAQKLAANYNYSFPKSIKEDFSVQNLHDIKIGLDAQLRAGSVKNQPTSLDEKALGGIESTKKAFVDWLETKVPEYGKARRQFAQDMGPVNKMQIGKALLGKLRSPQGTETPGAFLRAIDDETKLIKSATGMPRQVLDPQSKAIVDEVGGLLERKLESLSQANRASLPDGKNSVKRQLELELPSILSTPVVFANWVIKKLTSGSSPLEKRIDAIHTFWSLHPEKFAEAIKTMSAAEKSKVLSSLNKAGIRQDVQGFVAPSSLWAEDIFSDVK